MLRIFIRGVIAQYLQFSLSGMICTVFNNLRGRNVIWARCFFLRRCFGKYDEIYTCRTCNTMTVVMIYCLSFDLINALSFCYSRSTDFTSFVKIFWFLSVKWQLKSPWRDRCEALFCTALSSSLDLQVTERCVDLLDFLKLEKGWTTRMQATIARHWLFDTTCQ